MKLKEMSLAELKALSYTDIAYKILSEKKKTFNTPNLFKEVCNLLGYSDEEYTAQVGDFYTSLTTDCRFIILDNAEWDLRDKHIVKMEVDEDEDEEAVELDEDIEVTSDDAEIPETDEEEENIDEVIDDELDDDIEDDLEDLSIIEEDEEEEN